MSDFQEQVKKNLAIHLVSSFVNSASEIVDPARIFGLSKSDISDVYDLANAHFSAFNANLKANDDIASALDGVAEIMKDAGLELPPDAADLIAAFKEKHGISPERNENGSTN